MTDRTKSLIHKFLEFMDVNDVPPIIIGMQEEDSVYETLKFPNCFKRMRNMCAHEPAEFVAQLAAEKNKNCATIALSSSLNGTYTLQLYQFTAWMFYMYRKTNTREYLYFWQAFCVYMCPVLRHVKPTTELRLGLTEGMDIRMWIVDFEKRLCSEVGILRAYNAEDEYYNKIYKEDTKLYLRMVLANMQNIVVMLITGQIDGYDTENIDGYLRLYTKREGLDADRRAIQAS